MGEQRGNARITTEQALLIRSLRGKATQRELGARFNISHQVVGRIQRSLDWAHLERDLTCPG
jgi:hypothetical protein